MGTLVFEGVEQADDVFSAGMVGFGLDNSVEKLNLVDGGLGVVGSGADDLEGNVLAIGVVARQPDGRKVTPTKLAHDCILSILELLANLDGVVAAFAVVLGILLVSSVFGGIVNRG
jgi:hypothetical protein